MNTPIRATLALICAAVPAALVSTWISAAEARLKQAETTPSESREEVAVAAASDEGYCSADLKKVLRRVLQSCGLSQGGEVRGCQPVEARSVATLAGDDFNALFLPLAKRAGIIQFDKNKSELDPKDLQVLENTFADQQGASYFFVVSRSSPEGSVEHNRELSQARAQSVMDHLRKTFNDPDLDREVGLLWLGEEFAQLDDQFCQWTRSGDEKCDSAALNRSAFIAWIDCRL